MQTRTAFAGVMGATSALALLTAAPAEAHDTSAAKTAGYALGPHVSQRALLTSLVTQQLTRVETWAESLRAKAVAIPDDKVLTGDARALVQRWKAKALRASAALGTLDGLTAEQQARVAAIRADLRAAAAELSAVLANRPQPAALPVTVVPTLADSAKVGDVDGRHDCDGWDRDGDRRWDGARDGDRWRDGDRDGDRYRWRG